MSSPGLSCEAPSIHLSLPPQLLGYKCQPTPKRFIWALGIELRASCNIERTWPTKPSPQPLDVSFPLIKNIHRSHFMEKECVTQRQQTTFPKSHRNSEYPLCHRRLHHLHPKTMLLCSWGESDLILCNVDHHIMFPV